MRVRFVILVLLLAGGISLLPHAHSAAQILATNTPPAPVIPLATNTPAAQPTVPLAFATNTPAGLLPAVTDAPTATATFAATATPMGSRPQAGFDRYALRLWRETELVELLYEQITALEAGDPEAVRAAQLTNYELARRFPGAPRDFGARQQLVDAMLAAPRGSVDMREIIRPYLLGAINVSGAVEGVHEIAGFGVEIIPANLDGRGGRDALAHIVYPAHVDSESAVYEDFLPLIADGAGGYALPNGLSLIPAAPFADVERVELQRFNDITGDGVDDFALTVTYAGDVNRELLIFGWRADGIGSLIVPGNRVLFGALVDWPPDGRTFAAANYRLEESLWNCIDQLVIEWSYLQNFFRPIANPDPNADYASQNTLACFARGFEPIFEQPTATMITEFEALGTIFTPDEPGYERAQMVLAMLYVLADRPEAALAILNTLQTLYPNDAWVQAEAEAMRTALAAPNSSHVRVCAAVQFAVLYGACDLDQLLTRLFAEQPLSSALPVVEQLETRGIPVIQTVTIRSVGRLDREAINIAGDVWWAFAPLDAEFYSAEVVEPPAGYEMTFQTSLDLVAIFPPARAYDVLTGQNDPTAALLLIESTAGANPDVPLSAEARYFQALCYDLLGDRVNARRAYFELWTQQPGTLWAELAAQHLELR